jgi:UDP-N-acetylmuramoylalanine--D-glutamate ligase
VHAEILHGSRSPLALADRRVVVLGLAKSGRAAVELLRGHGARVVGVDEGADVWQRLPPEWVSAHLQAAERAARPEALAGAELLVLSPGVPTAHPLVASARARGIPVIAEIELAYRCGRAPVIAITGSKGKSTTTALVGHLLAARGQRAVVAGNIGLPYSAVVAAGEAADWIVLEVSSFQLETVDRFHAEVAVQLTISPDHLDRYPSLDAYAAAKARIARHQGASDLLVVDPDDAWGARLAARATARVVGFGAVWAGTGVVREAEEIVWRAPDTRRVLARVGDVPLLGSHNVGNAMAALAVVHGMGMWDASSVAALRGFAGLEFRMQDRGTLGGIRVVNDSKSTTVESVRAAVRGLPGPLLLALGGRNKGLDFSTLGADLAAVRAVLVYGEAAEQITRDLAGAARCVRVRDLDDLVQRALAFGQPGDTLLFSPGCTSFDMFQNAEHRGHAFDAAVERARGGVR